MLMPFFSPGAGSSKLLRITPVLGTGMPQTVVTGQNLAEGGLVIAKQTSAAEPWGVVDTERGGSNVLFFNSTSAESTGVSAISNFNANGVTLGTQDIFNQSGQDIALFTFLKQAGFLDVVTYTGDGSNPRNINHGLGVAPTMMWVKSRDNAQIWGVYHAHNTADPKTEILALNSDAATSDNATWWNDTAPTDTVFTVGSAANGNNDNHVAYLFADRAGASKAGTYEGTGSAGNDITGLGFEPSIVLTKNIDNAGDWAWSFMLEGTVYHLVPNATDAQAAALMAMDSDGFTLNSADQNASGDTYIYFAWR